MVFVNENRTPTFLRLWTDAKKHYVDVSDRLKKLSAFYCKVAAVPKVTATEVDENVEIVQIISPEQSFLNDCTHMRLRKHCKACQTQPHFRCFFSFLC